MGVDYWIVNPLLRIDRFRKGGLADHAAKVFEDLLILQDAADRAGISLVIDDEFDLLRHGAACIREPKFRSLNVRTRPQGVEIFRLAPNGQCSLDEDILKQVTPDVPRWRPHQMNAGDFIERIRCNARPAVSSRIRRLVSWTPAAAVRSGSSLQSQSRQ